MSIRNVSIIIPCYKAAATLRRAVASALTDAPSDIEILAGGRRRAPMTPGRFVTSWPPQTHA